MKHLSSTSSAVTLCCLTLLIAACSPAEPEDAMPEGDGAMMEEEGTMEAMPAVRKNDDPAMECGTKNAECETSADCCGNMGLECQEVRTSSGGFGNRCLPVEVNICQSDCTDGTWDVPRNCRAGVAPKDMVRCESFVGDDCKTSNSEHRNTRECTDT